MDRRTKLVAALFAGGVGLAVAGGGIALAQDGDDDRRPTDRPVVSITNADLDRAASAALEHVGSGTVTGTEADNDDRSPYEVEVTLDDGTQVDVELDEAFIVTREEREGPDNDRDDDRYDD